MVSQASKENPSSYDVIIIGCGMAGLAAGIRAAMYDKSVLILEKHNAPGGLNSFYFAGGRKCDVGLHAVTNYVGPEAKGTPLVKLFRQLRIPRDAFDLSPQLGSKIIFPGVSLQFTNDIAVLESEVAREFPRFVDGFRKLRQAVLAFDPFDLTAPVFSARNWMRQFFKNELLEDMILCPLMYYGSAREDDMDADQFVIMWRALFEEGFARPLGGVRVIIKALTDRYRELGGKRRMKAGVRQILHEGNRAMGVELESGEVLLGHKILSTVGSLETEHLLGNRPAEKEAERMGRLGYVETLSFFDSQEILDSWKDTILFFNTEERFNYRCPENPIDYRSGVICLPSNYDYEGGQTLEEPLLRVTALANPTPWFQFNEAEYRDAKKTGYEHLQRVALGLLPGQILLEHFSQKVTFKDMFTPKTVHRYTSHLNGSIYGSPHKIRDGKFSVEGLYLAGTDQGFLGIIGAMLSGISMANAHLLRS